MPGWLKLVLQVVGLTVVVLIVYNLLKIYVFPKVKVNKWVVLTLSIVGLFLPGVLRSNGINVENGIWGYIISGLCVILFLWFLDLNGWNGEGIVKRRQKKDEIVIKPKAKPNRVKNNANNQKKK